MNKSKEPALRFEGFSGPWQEKKFEDVFEFHQTNTFSRNELSNEKGQARNIHYGDILIKFGNIINDTSIIPFIKSDIDLKRFRPSSYLKNGDIIIADTAEDYTAGKALEVQNINSPILAGLHTMLCRPNHKSASGFWGYYLNSEAYHNKLIPLLTGTKVYSINKSNIKQTIVCFPSLAEQEKIAGVLCAADERISLQSQKVAALKRHKQALMQQLFPANGEPSPTLRFDGFCEPWQEKTLGEVCYILQGYGFPLSIQGKKIGKYPFYKVSDISLSAIQNNGKLVNSANYIDDYELNLIKAKTIPVGSTVFAKIGEALRLNRRAITTLESIIDNNNVALKSKDENTLDYFIFIISTLINLGEYCGGAIPSVNKATLEKIPIFVPSLAEQEKIAGVLSAADNLISLHEQKLNQLKRHKQALMQQLFPA